ncbi:hypothetical protein [Sporolactobacillus shoreae]|uniref:hypothetical protein n=1 Tax=Sporolactobacillus shoreae TaxID=1465501 RepID=UPI001F4F7D97|nr:hypothetical protein [Sporolactobacillus shoreae]
MLMNLISDAPYPPAVFIDPTVLCGALRVDGVNRKILKAARFPNLFHPVLSKVCIWEFICHTSKGLAGIQYK